MPRSLSSCNKSGRCPVNPPASRYLIRTGSNVIDANTSQVSSGDLVQLLYTSGTTSAPKGAMMTHAALVAQYISAIIALDLEASDRPLIAMPAFPFGGHARLFAPPIYPWVPASACWPSRISAEMLERVEAEHINSLFLAPTVWVPAEQPPGLETRNLDSLAKAQYGASIMPTTVLARLRERFPKIRVVHRLRPVRTRSAVHGAAPRGTRCPARFLRAPGLPCRSAGHQRPGPAGRGRRTRKNRVPPPAGDERILEQAGGNRAGLHRRLVPFRRPGGQGFEAAISRWRTASRMRSTPAGCWWPRAKSRTPSTSCPKSPRWLWWALMTRAGFEAIAAVIVLKDASSSAPRRYAIM